MPRNISDGLGILTPDDEQEAHSDSIDNEAEFAKVETSRWELLAADAFCEYAANSEQIRGDETRQTERGKDREGHWRSDDKERYCRSLLVLVLGHDDQITYRRR